MNIYLVEYIVLFFCVLLSNYTRRKTRKRIFVFCAIQLILITVLRSPFDKNWPDTLHYCETLVYLNKINMGQSIFYIETRGWEPGIVVLSKIIGIFSENYQFYVVVFGLLILIPLFAMMWQYSEKPILSLLLFYAMRYLRSTSIYRQWLAIAILCFSVKYIYDRKFGKFILLVILAFLFHITAVAFVVAYFLYNIKPKKRYIFLEMIFLGMLISVFFVVIGQRVLQILNAFARIEATYEPNGGISMWIVLWAFTWIGILFIFIGNYYSDAHFSWLLNMVLFAAIIQPISFTYSNWARMVLYFGMFSILLLPKIITGIENMKAVNKNVNLLIESVFMAVMFIWFSMFGIPEYLPMWRYNI